jgi:hypothetical protein
VAAKQVFPDDAVTVSKAQSSAQTAGLILASDSGSSKQPAMMLRINRRTTDRLAALRPFSLARAMPARTRATRQSYRSAAD